MTQIAIGPKPGEFVDATFRRQVILASASIPGIFRRCTFGSRPGASCAKRCMSMAARRRRFLLLPCSSDCTSSIALYSPPQHRIFVITNSRLAPDWGPEERRPGDRRALASDAEQKQGAGDLIRLYLLAKRDGAEFNLAAIPLYFPEKSKEPFDRRYMRALFDVGFVQGRAGHRWLPAPPKSWERMRSQGKGTCALAGCGNTQSASESKQDHGGTALAIAAPTLLAD